MKIEQAVSIYNRLSIIGVFYYAQSQVVIQR